jgi:hypothetical protein
MGLCRFEAGRFALRGDWLGKLFATLDGGAYGACHGRLFIVGRAVAEPTLTALPEADRLLC